METVEAQLKTEAEARSGLLPIREAYEWKQKRLVDRYATMLASNS